MFEFHQEVPEYHNIFFKLADMLSGSLFWIVGLFSYVNELYVISLIFFAVGLTSVVHVFFPYKLLRLVDYSLAVTCVVICLILVVQSGFLFPYSIWAAICCGISLTIYAVYQTIRNKRSVMRNLTYYSWHIGAMSTSLLSLTAFIQSL